MAESQLNPGKSPDLADQSEARAVELDRPPAEQELELLRDLVRRAAAELLLNGQATWKLPGSIGDYTVGWETEQEAQPNGPHNAPQSSD